MSWVLHVAYHKTSDNATGSGSSLGFFNALDVLVEHDIRDDLQKEYMGGLERCERLRGYVC